MNTSNGDQVVIKKIKTGSSELRIGLYLSSPELKEDSRNHCVPILDHFQDEEDETVSFLVMPLLRRFDDPKFGDQILAVSFPFLSEASKYYIDER